MIKRITAMLLILSLAITLAPVSQAKKKTTIKLKSKDVPTYYLSTDNELTIAVF